MEHFPHCVTVNEHLFEIVLALRDNISEHLEMTTSSFESKTLRLCNSSSKS